MTTLLSYKCRAPALELRGLIQTGQLDGVAALKKLNQLSELMGGGQMPELPSSLQLLYLMTVLITKLSEPEPSKILGVHGMPIPSPVEPLHSLGAGAMKAYEPEDKELPGGLQP